MTHCLLAGCWFGLPNNDNLGVLISDILPSQLAAVDVEDEPGKLAQALSELPFTREELSTGCATKPRKAGIIKFDPTKLHAIRGKCIPTKLVV